MSNIFKQYKLYTRVYLCVNGYFRIIKMGIIGLAYNQIIIIYYAITSLNTIIFMY